jgi:hypothetical protein
VNGGSATRLSQDWYRVTFAAPSAPSSSAPPEYTHRSLTVTFQSR